MERTMGVAARWPKDVHISERPVTRVEDYLSKESTPKSRPCADVENLDEAIREAKDFLADKGIRDKFIRIAANHRFKETSITLATLLAVYREKR